MQGMRLWTLKAVDALRPAPPPALTGKRWARDFNEVKSLVGLNKTARTAHETLMARCRITPGIMPTLRRITDMPRRRTVDNARLIAKVYIVDYDEGLAMIDAKMYYQLGRPITAIRNADADGNSETLAEPGWVPLTSTPNHLEYPCGYCGSAAAMDDVIKAEVGDTPRGGVEIASKSITDAVPMRIHRFDAWVKEVSYSRTLGGVHYRSSNEAGEELGHRAAAAATGLMAPLAPGAKARNHWRR